MGTLHDYLTQETLFNNVNRTLRETAANISRRANNNYYHTSSRTLNEILNSNLAAGYYWNARHIGNNYAFLLGLASTLINNKPIQINAAYRTISSTEAETLTLDDILSDLSNDTSKCNITLYHIPKGKTYLKHLLENETTELERIPQIENLLIENTTQFTRVYHTNAMNEDVVIFSEKYTVEMFETIITMIPHLLKLTPKDNPEENEEIALFNNKIAKLRDIYAFLYNIKTYLTENTTDQANEELLNLIANFAELFDFETININSFIENLANIRNTTANSYYTNELHHIEHDIANYEQTLASIYARQAELRRLLNAYKTIAPTDVQPFLETIKESKAIEILSTTDTTLQLRITAPFQFFTEADFTAYENNPNSEYNRHFTNEIDRNILHKLFVTREYKLLAEGIITIRLYNNSGYYNSNQITFEAQRGGIDLFNNFPNPHLYHHNCWSAAQSEMLKNLNADNYDLVVMQMIAAVQTINIAEHASFVNGLLSDFQQTSFQMRMHFIDKEGKEYTYAELYDIERKKHKEDTLKEAEETINTTNASSGYTQVELPDDGDWPDLTTVTEQLDNLVVNHDRNTITINGNEIPITTATTINPINTTTYYTADTTTATQGIQGV